MPCNIFLKKTIDDKVSSVKWLIVLELTPALKTVFGLICPLFYCANGISLASSYRAMDSSLFST
jgi:hypothetical protein